ncbi:MAG: sulfatase family protein, partial [Verrucomicrobiales bacterium]
SEITQGFVDEALPFIDKAVSDKKPFYINLWPDDVHSPFWPPVDQWGDGGKRALYLAVLQEMDRQLGKLFDRIRNDQALRDNTLILVCSDNGPEQGAGTAGPFRGYKTHLYEGGIRSSLIAWGPGLLAKKDHINRASVFSAIDLVPTLLKLTDTPTSEDTHYDGEALPDVLLGQSEGSCQAPIFFRRPPDRDSFYGDKDLPDLAVRSGKWKFLCEYDGFEPELYDMATDRSETTNIAADHPEIVTGLTKSILAWHHAIPPDKGANFVKE